MSRSSLTTLALTVGAALVLSGCGGSSGAGPTASVTPTVAPSATGPVAVLATDQPCTATVGTGATTATLGIAPHELAGMLLDSSALPVVVSAGWQPVVDSVGYLENQAYATQYLSTEGCATLVRTGRVTGYLRAWMGETQLVTTGVHLFSTVAGAAEFLRWLPSGYAKGQSFPAAYYTVTSSASRPLDGVGDGALLLDVSFGSDVNGSYAARIAAVRVGDVVVTVDAQGGTAETLPLDPTSVASTAVDKVRSAPRTGQPLDVVTVLSAPVPQKDLGPTYAALSPNFMDGGCADAATTLARSSDPDIARTLKATGWLESVQGLYAVPDETSPNLRVSTGIAVYATAEGARAGRDHSIAALRSGDAQREPASTFAVPGVSGAVGLLVDRHSEGCVCSEAWVILPTRGTAVPRAYVGDVPGADRRDQAVAAAVALASRLDTVLGRATT